MMNNKQILNAKIRKAAALFSFILFLISFVCLLAANAKEKTDAGIHMENYTSNSAVFDQNEWYVDDSMLSEGAKDCVFLYGPVKPLSKGSYEMHIVYSAETENKVSISAARFTDNSNFLKFTKTPLPIGNHEFIYTFDITHDIDNWEIFISHTAGGSLRVSDITILRTFRAEQSSYLFFALLFLLLSLILVSLPYLIKKWNIVICLILLIVVAALPVFTPGIHGGTATDQFLMRIETVANDISAQLFPTVYSMDWLKGYGYLHNVSEGSLFLFFPAILRLLGFSVTAAYKSHLLLIGILTVLLAYYSFGQIFKDEKTALLLTFVYLTAACRFSGLYFQANVEEATAFAFLPLFCLGIHRLLDEKKNGVFLMIITLTALIESHLATALACIVLLFLIFIIRLPRIIKNGGITRFIGILAGTLLMNAFFLVPYLDTYQNAQIQFQKQVQTEHGLLTGQSVSLQKLLAFFQPLVTDQPVLNQTVFQTPGLVLILLSIVGITCFLFYKRSAGLSWMMFAALGLTLLCTNLIPWNLLADKFAFFNVLFSLTSPASFLGPLCCALVLLFGTAYTLISQDKNRMISLLLTAFLVIAGLGSLGYYATVYETYSVPLTYTGKENILSDKVLNSQFLPVEGRLSTILDTGYIPETDALTVKLKRETAVSRTVTVQNGTASSSLVFPLFYYPNLNAYNKDGKPLVVSKTNEGKAVVRIPADYFGDVTIRYEIPSLWKQAGRLSFIFMLLLIGGKLLLIYLQLPKDWFRLRLVIKPAAGENEKRI